MQRLQIFERIEPPRAQARLAVNQVAAWYTWSPEFCSVIRDLRPWICQLDEPKLVRIRGLDNYDYTFASPAPVPEAMRPFIRSLCAIKRPRGIMLFTRLLNRRLDSLILRRLFALLRRGIAEHLCDERFSLYAPLSNTGKHAGDFALHADLYLPELLFNVFELVPGDSTGASTFLSTADLNRILRKIPSIPKNIARRIRECLTKPVDKDRFDEFFDLLHGPDQPWSSELSHHLAQREMTIKFAPGQGYLVHDRTWLHGRKTATGGVPVRRVHRLVFNTTSIQRRRRASAT
jgi:hypothetical protein